MFTHATIQKPFLERNMESSEYLRLRFIMSYLWPVIFVLAFIAEMASYLPLKLQHKLLNGHMKNMDDTVNDDGVCVCMHIYIDASLLFYFVIFFDILNPHIPVFMFFTPPTHFHKVRDFTVASMLAFGVICNYLYLGKTEFENHETLYDVEDKFTPYKPSSSSSSNTTTTTTAKDVKDKVHLFYTDGDFWAPLHVEAKMRQQFGVKTTVKEGIPHAFGVSRSSSEVVAEWTSSYLSDIVRSTAHQ
jgi:hypothetical protein